MLRVEIGEIGDGAIGKRISRLRIGGAMRELVVERLERRHASHRERHVGGDRIVASPLVSGVAGAPLAGLTRNRRIMEIAIFIYLPAFFPRTFAISKSMKSAW